MLSLWRFARLARTWTQQRASHPGGDYWKPGVHLSWLGDEWYLALHYYPFSSDRYIWWKGKDKSLRKLVLRALEAVRSA